MARFFQAPIVQPMDYGFKLPFNEIMGALRMKQQEQDTAVAELGKIYDDTANSLAVDYPLRDAYLADKQRRIDSIMYDAQGNLQDLTGKTREIQAEARRQISEKKSGGIHWGVEGSLDNRTKYNESVEKNEKITADQKIYLTERSDYEYNIKGGLGKPQGPNGLYSEQQLYQGIKPANYVDIEKVGDGYGKDAGDSQIQISGVQIDPKTSQVLGGEDGLFKDVHNGMFVQTGTLLTKTYDQIFNATANGLTTNKEALEYMEQEARTIAWKAGNKNPTQEQIQQHIDTRILEESDRIAHKYMSAKFQPMVYQHWRNAKAADHRYKMAQIDYEKAKDLKPIETPINTVQNVINTKDLFTKRTTTEESLKAAKEKVASMTGPDGKLLPMFASDPSRVQEFKAAQNQARLAQLQLDGLKNTEDLILKKQGYNDANIAIATVEQVLGSYLQGNEERDKVVKEHSNSLISYIVTGKYNLATLNPDDLKKVKNFNDQIQHYAGNFEEIERVYDKGMRDRAINLMSGNHPKELEKLLGSRNYGDANNPGVFMMNQLQSSFKKRREDAIVNASNNINATGGLNFTAEGTTLTSTDSPTASYLTAVNTSATEEFKKNNYAGLVVSQGLYAGEEFTPATLLKGVSGYEGGQVKSIKIDVMPQNTSGIGRGGKPQWRISGEILNSDGKKPKIIEIVTTLDPKKASSLVAARDEAAMQMLENVADKRSEQYAQEVWSSATQMLGGSTDLMYNMFDQLDTAASEGAEQVIKDSDGRPLIGVRKNYGGTWSFFEPFKDSKGDWKVEFNPDRIIKDTRANHYNTGKTEFQHITDLQELVGEKVYDIKRNRKSLDSHRALFNLPRYVGDSSSMGEDPNAQGMR
jgi:hypothetical protein